MNMWGPSILLRIWEESFLVAVGGDQFFYCLYFSVDCTNLRPLDKLGVPKWFLKKSIKHHASKCTDQSWRETRCSTLFNLISMWLMKFTPEKWLKLSDGKTGANKPLRSLRELRKWRKGIDWGAFLNKEGKREGLSVGGKRQESNLEHLLQSSVTNVKKVSRLKMSWIHRREGVIGVVRAGQLERGGKKATRKR